MPDTFADASRPPEAAIEIRLGRPQQLFNLLDPSPFHERDLDEDAEAYIVDSDHLGSLQQDGLRNGQAESLGGLQMDEQVELRGCSIGRSAGLASFRILSTWVTGP